jgi:Glycosyl hydrolase family 20, catalytic domain
MDMALGGDEVNMADDCFREVSRHPFDYTNFERDVRNILKELNYPNEKVVRWERTGQSENVTRAGEIEHYWENLPGVKSAMPKLPNGEFQPWFVSKGLYFDTNHQDDAYMVHRNTLSALNLEGIPKPKAIIAGTFELGVEFWLQRNVATRLIAVSSGASKGKKVSGKQDFISLFNQTCLDLGLDQRWCNLQGATSTLHLDFMNDHEHIWSEWKAEICEKLTVEELQLAMKYSGSTKKRLETAGYEFFWNNFGNDNSGRQVEAVPQGKIKPSKYSSHSIPLTGVIFDMVNSMRSSPSDVKGLLKKYIAPFGFNVLQLRLVDDSGFRIQLESQPKLGYSALHDGSKSKGKVIVIPTALEYRDLVETAMTEYGIQTIPELSLSTDAGGGWLHAGFAARCPHTLCDGGGGVTNAIAEPELLPVIYSVLREIRQIFSTSSFIHLGHDNRQKASNGCLKEAGLLAYPDPMKTLSEFEEKLGLLVSMVEIEQGNILRWNNGENKHYPDRTGQITHYKAPPKGQMPKPSPDEDFFLTVDLTNDSPWQVFAKTRALVSLSPKGILGEIRDTSENAFENMFVGLRLVAFALGLQKEVDGIDEQRFEKLLLETCRDVKFSGCDKPYKSMSAFIEVDQSRYKDKICSEFTINQMGRAPRKDIS